MNEYNYSISITLNNTDINKYLNLHLNYLFTFIYLLLDITIIYLLFFA